MSIKVTALTALSAAASNDVLYIVDVSENQSKKITTSDLASAVQLPGVSNASETFEVTSQNAADIIIEINAIAGQTGDFLTCKDSGGSVQATIDESGGIHAGSSGNNGGGDHTFSAVGTSTTAVVYVEGGASMTGDYIAIRSSGSGTDDIFDIDADGNLSVDTDVLVVDAVNDRVGVNKAAPGVAFDVDGEIRADGTTSIWLRSAIGAILIDSSTTIRKVGTDLQIGQSSNYSSLSLYAGNSEVVDLTTSRMNLLSIALLQGALSADPADPAADSWTLWMSDGTGSGDDGDIMAKVTDSGGTTKTITVIDYSAS